ncbi:internal scaffolding protein [Microviridae sp.]|nr:internal scaffolding protein [Microviridae sp.]
MYDHEKQITRVRPPYFRKRKQIKIEGESLTHQSMKDECDINNIMKKWEKTGILEHKNNFQGQYGDFTQVPSDYHESMNQVLAANEMFETLPAKIRKQFGNDPGQFLDFATDPENNQKMIDMGLKGQVIEVIERDEKPENKPKKSAQKPAENQEDS